MAASSTHKGWLYNHDRGLLAAVYDGAKAGARVLATNTALDGVLVGTPVTPALAVDSLVLSNNVASGDVLIAAASSSGNSQAYAWIDASAGTLTLYGAGTAALTISATAVKSSLALSPLSTDGAALGSTSLMWSDLFLASGGVINFNNGNVTITQAAGKLTVAAAAPTTSIDCFTVGITSGSATPGTVRAIVGSMTSFTSMTSGGLVGVRGVVTQAAAVSGASNYGVQGKYITGAYSAAGTLAAVYTQFDMTGGTIGAGNIAVIQANIVGCASGTVALNGLYIEQAGGGAINSYLRLLGNATYVMDIESSYTNQSTTGTAGSTAAKGWLKVLVTNGGGAVVRYIPLTDSVS
jgi:hypothetical protein